MPLERLPFDALEMQYSIAQGLLPACPFCGGERFAMSSSVNETPHFGSVPIFQAIISCSDHHCHARVFANERSREKAQQGAIAAWSRRATTPKDRHEQ